MTFGRERLRIGTREAARGGAPLLVAGDVLALVAVVLVGLSSHRQLGQLLPDLARVATPFVLGWLVAAGLAGVYRTGLRRGDFMLRSVAAWAGGVGLGLLLRNTVFGSQFSPAFAVVSYLTNGIAVLGWRAAYSLWLPR